MPVCYVCFMLCIFFPRTSIIVTALLLSSNIMGESDLEDLATHPFEHITAASNIVIQVFQYNFATHFYDKPLMNHPFPQLHCFFCNLIYPFHQDSVSLQSSKITNITKEWTTMAWSLTRRCRSFQGSLEESQETWPRYCQLESGQNFQYLNKHKKSMQNDLLKWMMNLNLKENTSSRYM